MKYAEKRRFRVSSYFSIKPFFPHINPTQPKIELEDVQEVLYSEILANAP